MKIIYSNNYLKQYKKIKDNQTRLEIHKKITRLLKEFKNKKRLRNILSGKQTIRIKEKRVIYEVKENKIILHSVKHRRIVYK